MVVIKGLVGAAQHNGKRATVLTFMKDRRRFVLRLESEVECQAGQTLNVKPANIVVDTCTDTFKLCDWIGSEAEEASLALGKPVGTPLFMAPEVAGCPHRHCISSDTWALGCTILNLITGRLPWEGADAHGRTNEFMALWLTSQGHAPPYDTHAMSPALSSFVALCFEPSTLLRPCAAELRGHDLFCRPC